jgi:tellurite methyltransferase
LSLDDKKQWNERYRAGNHSSPEPDPFLAKLDDYAGLLPSSRRALDVACGSGRNAVWLARHGWSVTGCDLSIEALGRAGLLARENGVALDLLCVDLESFSPPLKSFDLIICFFYLQRDLFSVLGSALRPGGFLVYKTYTVDQLQFPVRPRHPQHLLQHQELLRTFPDLRVLHYEETVLGRGVAQLMARKPKQ